MNALVKSGSDLSAHLRDDATYIQCSLCGRKSWGERVNSSCDLTQPDGKLCNGVLEGKKNERTR